MDEIAAVVLAIHLFSAILFIGGSFFMWLVVVPVSYQLAPDEASRTELVGKIARSFAKWTNPTLAVLILTGLYNASWYLPSTTPLGRELLEVKVVLVGVLVLSIYVHGLYYGRTISRLARERKVDKLREVRKRSRFFSMANLALMVAIVVIVALMQVYG
jgi:uncharacterized membrane protein